MVHLMPEKAPPGMPPSPRIDGRVIDCFGAKTNRDRNEITCTIVRVLGGVSLHPCNLFHRLITARTHPRVKVGHCWSNGERPLTVSPTRHGFDQRVQPSKRDDCTLMRRTSQQEEAQEWCRSTFWLRLVARRKLLAVLQPSVASRTQM